LDGDEQVRAEQEQPAPVCVRTLDPMTGSCDLAADCGGTLHQTRGQMTAQQVANVDALKAASAEFTAMRRLAMRFRGLLRGGTPERLDAWLIDARVWDLRDARFCEDDTPGPGGRSERCVGTLEQWADRRTNQQIEDPQASDGWPHRCRVAPRSDDAVAGRQVAPRVNQIRLEFLVDDRLGGVGAEPPSSATPSQVSCKIQVLNAPQLQPRDN
jgi:hypothetical protein